MNTTNDPPENQPEPHTTVDPLDERLSAGLDGHEPEPEPATAPDATALARGRELAAARDLLAVPPPRLDDITRDRLLRTALDASPTSSRTSRERASRRARPVAVAAAVLAVVGLSGWGLASLNHSSSNNASSSRAATAETTARSAPVDLHEVSNPTVLKQRVEAALNTPSAPANATTVPNPTETTVPGSAKSPAECLATASVPTGDTPELLGTATFHGAPALVVVAREPARTLIFVLARGDCRLLTYQFLKG
jgi:hypothetical protein